MTDLMTETLDPETPPEPSRALAIPAKAGTYHIGQYRVIVRRRRDPPVWLRNEAIRTMADQRGWSRTALARRAAIDNSYTAPKIWDLPCTRVTLPVAERIASALEVGLEQIAWLGPDGASYDPAT